MLLFTRTERLHRIAVAFVVVVVAVVDFDTRVQKKGSLPTTTARRLALLFAAKRGSTKVQAKSNRAERLISNPKGSEILLIRTPDWIDLSVRLSALNWMVLFVQSRVILKLTLNLLKRNSHRTDRLRRFTCFFLCSFRAAQFPSQYLVLCIPRSNPIWNSHQYPVTCRRAPSTCCLLRFFFHRTGPSP